MERDKAQCTGMKINRNPKLSPANTEQALLRLHLAACALFTQLLFKYEILCVTFCMQRFFSNIHQSLIQ